MDGTTYYIINKIHNGTISSIDLLLFIFVTPLVLLFLDYMKKNFYQNLLDFYKNLKNRKSCIKELTIIGYETCTKGNPIYDFPEIMVAICYYIKSSNKMLNIKYINNARTYSNWWMSKHNINEKYNNYINYILSPIKNYKINDKITVDMISLELSNDKTKEREMTIITQHTLILKSTSDDHMNEFINICMKQYEKSISDMNRDKLFHFIYRGTEKQTNGSTNCDLIFTQSLMSDLSDNQNNETFDHIFNEHKDVFIKDILRLRDSNYYKKTGMKRKKGYLFYGYPGCGKTATVQAMANMDNRHIIEIPISRVKSGIELEQIFSLTSINGVNFNKNEIIILFDEIDISADSIKKRISSIDSDTSDQNNEVIRQKITEEKTTETFVKILAGSNEEKKYDELSLGTMLSRLDGIGNYNGLIIVATTNNISKIDPAIYRDLRLTLYFFDYCRKEDIIAMTEKFYGVKLSDEQIFNYIPDRDCKVTPAKLKVLIEKNEDDLMCFLKNIKKYKDI